MTIDDLIQNLSISDGNATAIRNNREIIQHIAPAIFDSVFNTIVKFLDSIQNEPIQNQVGRKYIRRYTNQPNNDCQRHLVVFSPSKTGRLNGRWNADGERWIARMPLRPQAAPILIYFPAEIIKNENANRFTPHHGHGYEILNPEAFDDFCNNPEDFLCRIAIGNRLNRVG